jgi:hypothetical protein
MFKVSVTRDVGYVEGTKMACCLTLLPSYLSEKSVATLSKGVKRRSFWKPSTAESMSHFVDIQNVIFALILNEAYKCDA